MLFACFLQGVAFTVASSVVKCVWNQSPTTNGKTEIIRASPYAKSDFGPQAGSYKVLQNHNLWAARCGGVRYATAHNFATDHSRLFVILRSELCYFERWSAKNIVLCAIGSPSLV
ncbi:hypothetical protein TNCV_2158831 [Trichonephila clavipes]|nr:hypothetical protein TNCV_2158831 [Trichonephila clavipes]